MNIQNSRVIENSNNVNSVSTNNSLTVGEAKRQGQRLKSIISERRQSSNKLLFWLTVTALTAIMGGSILFAINQYQLPKTSSHATNSYNPLQS